MLTDEFYIDGMEKWPLRKNLKLGPWRTYPHLFHEGMEYLPPIKICKLNIPQWKNTIYKGLNMKNTHTCIYTQETIPVLKKWIWDGVNKKYMRNGEIKITTQHSKSVENHNRKLGVMNAYFAPVTSPIITLYSQSQFNKSSNFDWKAPMLEANSAWLAIRKSTFCFHSGSTGTDCWCDPTW